MQDGEPRSRHHFWGTDGAHHALQRPYLHPVGHHQLSWVLSKLDSSCKRLDWLLHWWAE
jgi:hypothetical protein